MKHRPLIFTSAETGIRLTERNR